MGPFIFLVITGVKNKRNKAVKKDMNTEIKIKLNEKRLH